MRKITNLNIKKKKTHFLFLMLATMLSMSFCSKDHKEELDEIVNKPSSQKVKKPIIEVLTKASTYMDFSVAFKIKSDEAPKSVKIYYGRNSEKTSDPIINKSSNCKRDKVISGNTYYYTVTHSGFSGGNYIYFYGEVKNSAGTAKTDVKYTIIKRGM